MEIKFGKIVFQTANAGSKSESVQPFLLEADGTMTQVFLAGDNPFMNTTLRSFDGKNVAVSGGKKEGSVIFTVQAIKENPLSESGLLSKAESLLSSDSTVENPATGLYNSIKEGD